MLLLPEKPGFARSDRAGGFEFISPQELLRGSQRGQAACPLCCSTDCSCCPSDVEARGMALYQKSKCWFKYIKTCRRDVCQLVSGVETPAVSPGIVSPGLPSAPLPQHTLWFSCCRMVSVGLQYSRYLPVFRSNVLRNVLWSCLVPCLDSICMSPTERHVQTWCPEAQVVVPEGLGDLQCSSSFCAGPKTDSSTQGCREPWGAAGQAPNTWTWWGSGDR